MTANAITQFAAFFVGLFALALPLGSYMARVYSGNARFAQRILGPLEQACYRLTKIDPAEEMPWKQYALSVLAFNFCGTLLVYLLLRLQSFLPLNPDHLVGVSPEIAFNTAVSFATNTNWQAYSGETTLSPLVQMLGLGTQNFLSAATGMAVLAAFLRGFTRRTSSALGNFWVDLTRTTLFILLPLSLVMALLLVSEGVVQTLASGVSVHPLDLLASQGSAMADRTLALGPAASQVAIKQLGTNGGGFFNVNSAHPLENPTALSNYLQVVAILLIPAALCFTFGSLIRDRRQGWAVLGAMLAIFLPLLLATSQLELSGNPSFSGADVNQNVTALSSGGNLEGKEVRFGVTGSTLWAVATTAASNGSVNAMHDSLTPLGGLIPMWLIQLGEIVFGGVGSGLYGMLVYALIAVFIAGLMVGRTPEYLGKKIEAYEMRMASLVILLPAAATLIGTAIACLIPEAMASIGNPGAHGFSEILYAFSSGANNNGSAFGGLTVTSRFYTVAIGVCMWIGRYWVIVPTLAIAGSLAKKKSIPPSSGTFPTHTPLFTALLVGTILLIGALTFLPALALGPVVEHLQLPSR